MPSPRLAALVPDQPHASTAAPHALALALQCVVQPGSRMHAHGARTREPGSSIARLCRPTAETRAPAAPLDAAAAAMRTGSFAFVGNIAMGFTVTFTL